MVQGFIPSARIFFLFFLIGSLIGALGKRIMKMFVFFGGGGDIAVLYTRQHFLGGTLHISIVRKSGAPRFKPVAGG